MILLTGATGLLGSHLAKALVASGSRFRAVARKPLKRSYLGQLDLAVSGVDFRTVDIGGPIDSSLFEGIDTVIHSAALASYLPADLEAMRAVNVTAAQNLYAAAAASGVSRWLQVSSIAALGRPTGYAATKREFDQWLEGRGDRIEKTFIHPCYMFDEWDARPSSGTILFALKLGKVTAFVDSVKSFVAARDVAAASLTSLARAKSGHYVIGGENLKLRRFFEIACEEVGVPFTLRELGSLEEAPDPALREFCFNAEADSSRAQDELGYRPTLDVRAMIRAALEYFQKFKMLKREAR